MGISKPFPRLWSLDAGTVMVVTDLHGDGEAYRRYRDCFLGLHSGGRADFLVFTGDLIHQSVPGNPDRSLDMVLDLLELQAVLGDAVIFLCGNHELAHIYSFGLARGNIEYTPPFEKALSQSGQCDVVIELFCSLPLFIRTAAGVSLTHAGASEALALPQKALGLFNWSHVDTIAAAKIQVAQEDATSLRRAYAKLSGAKSYDDLARHYLAVTDSHDPRFDDLLVYFFVSMEADFEHLRAALFTRCEQTLGVEKFSKFLKAMLQNLSEGYAEQRFLVAGHTAVSGGHQLVAGRHLRLASAAHAAPPEAGQYLLFDAEKPVRDMNALLSGLQSVFKTGP